MSERCLESLTFKDALGQQRKGRDRKGIHKNRPSIYTAPQRPRDPFLHMNAFEPEVRMTTAPLPDSKEIEADNPSCVFNILGELPD